MRILVIGASGSGTTTVGAALAGHFGLPHIESDDLFWIPTDPPYQYFHTEEVLHDLVQTHLISHDRWVLSGSPCKWGDALMPVLDLAVFLDVPADTRIARLKEREAKRFGDRIAEGGDMYESHVNFLAWSAAYDAGEISGRSRPKHEAWLAQLSCPVLQVGNKDFKEIVSTVVEHVAK